MTRILHVFPFSNYCEKAEWVADLSGLAVARKTHLPGPHGGKIRKLSGQTSVPVLEEDGRVITESAAIASHLGAPLPEEAGQRDEVMGWQARLDEIGGVLRAALFFAVMPHPGCAARLLTCNKGGVGLFLYRQMARGLAPKLLKMLRDEGLTPEATLAQSRAVLDEVADAAAATGYLVGDRFTLADLTAAAIFFPTSFPIGSPAAAFAQSAPDLAGWRKAWEGHPGQAYIRRIYRDHRRV